MAELSSERVYRELLAAGRQLQRAASVVLVGDVLVLAGWRFSGTWPTHGDLLGFAGSFAIGVVVLSLAAVSEKAALRAIRGLR